MKADDEQNVRQHLILLWNRYGSSYLSDSSEGEELADEIMKRYTLTPKSS